MKVFLLALLLPMTLFAARVDLGDIYGNMVEGCTYAADIDEGDADRIGPLDADALYTVFCYDSATFLGIACRYKVGTSTVDASSGELADAEAELLFLGEKTAVFINRSFQYISFEPLADGTTQVGVACKRN